MMFPSYVVIFKKIYIYTKNPSLVETTTQINPVFELFTQYFKVSLALLSQRWWGL